jgi:hypothetical protein
MLSYGSESVWRHVGWHQIEHGGWNAEAHKLSWSTYDGSREFIDLVEPGRMPELFRERVSASIVAERFVPIAGERGVTISGRRDLAEASPSPGTRHSAAASVGTPTRFGPRRMLP